MIPFLEPLDPNDEAKFLLRRREGDEQARNALVEHNLRLVAHIARKYRFSGLELNELLSIGTLGLMKAVDSFDESKGRLSTFAARCIENEFLMMLRKEKKSVREISLYEPIGTDREGNAICLKDVIVAGGCDVDEECEKRELADKIPGLLKETLTQREYYVIIKRYGLFGNHEMTQSEIGRNLGISRSYVSRLEKKALSKLFDRMEKEAAV